MIKMEKSTGPGIKKNKNKKNIETYLNKAVI